MDKVLDVQSVTKIYASDRGPVHALENFSRMKGEVFNCGHEGMNYSKSGFAMSIKAWWLCRDHIVQNASFFLRPGQSYQEKPPIGHLFLLDHRL